MRGSKIGLVLWSDERLLVITAFHVAQTIVITPEASCAPEHEFPEGRQLRSPNCADERMSGHVSGPAPRRVISKNLSCALVLPFVTNLYVRAVGAFIFYVGWPGKPLCTL